MNKVQFASPLKNFQGDDVMEDDGRGLPETVHLALRGHLERTGAQQPLIDVLNALVRPKRLLTLGDVAVRSLNSVPQGQVPDARQAIARFELQRRIIGAEKSFAPLALESDEQALIKSSLPHAGWTPWIIGQASEMVEGKQQGAHEAQACAAGD